MGSKLKILLFGTNKTVNSKIKNEVEKNGHNLILESVPSTEEFKTHLTEDNPDAVIISVNKSENNVFNLIAIRDDCTPLIPVTVISESPDIDFAIECLKAGADDFLTIDKLPILTNSLQSTAGGRFTASDKTSFLKKRSDLLANLVYNSSSDSMYLVGVEPKDVFRLISVNKAYLKTTGLKESEILGKTVNEMKENNPYKEFVISKYKEAINNRKATQHEEYYDFGNGKIYVDVTLTPIFNEEGICTNLLGAARDITKNILAEAALKENEERYRLLINNMNEGVLFVDNDDVIKYINKRCCEIYGYEQEELIGNSGNEILIHKDDRHIIIEKNIERTKGISEVYTVRALKKTGEIVWTNISGAPMFDNTGEVIGSIGIISDITDQKSAEEKLRKTERFYKAIIENAPDGIVTIGTDGKFDFISDNSKRIFGYPADETANFHPADNTHPEDLPMVLKALEEIMLNPEFVPVLDYRFKSSDGSWRWIESTFSNLYGDPNVNAIVINFRDITDRKIAEMELQDSEERYKAITTNLPSYVLVHQDNKIAYMNKSGLDMIGCTEEEIRGKSIFDFLNQEHKELVSKNIQRRLAGETIEDYEIEVITKENIKVIALVRGIPIKYEKKPAFLVVLTDITELKLSEGELIKAKGKAEDSDRIKSNFLANMSHELRTPMVGILGFSEILNNELTDDTHKLMASRVYKGGKRLMNTLNLILDLSRIVAGKLETNYKLFNINEIILNSISHYEQVIKKKNIYIKFINDNGIMEVRLDERMMTDIINNLINNAVKYTEYGGIEVTSKFIYENGKRFAELKVKDTGIGIPSDKTDLIFEEFRQVSEGYSRTFEGTGLGLSLTKKFVEKMNGTISVESELGKGALFTIKVPVNESDSVLLDLATGKDLAIKDSLKSNKMYSLLVVDNDYTTLLLVQAYLKGRYSIHTAKNCKEVLDKAKSIQYDLVLMDINLGKEESGLEATRQLRKIDSYRNTPIIAMTAFAMDGDKEEFLSSGCTDYISKPFVQDDLINLINRVIETFK